jgi:TonB family protein
MAAPKPSVREPALALPAVSASGGFAPVGQPLLALTQDAQLLETLRKVGDPAHEVCAVGSELDFSAALLKHHAGVAVLDCAAIASPIAQLTQRLGAQFPELVLIVAGGIEEQSLLAAQIGDGSVHRFLHKPLSDQRVRLFVESAWRRHGEVGALPLTAPRRVLAPKRRHRELLWGTLLALAALAVPLAWIVTHPPERNAPRTPSAARDLSRPQSAVPADSELESLLTRADQALSAGSLTTPRGASAADLYREALRHNARDPRALNGLEQVIGRLLGSADVQLQQGHLEGAQALAEQTRAIDPQNPRVAFLLGEIATARERAVLDRAQSAAAGGDVAGALAVLDGAARSAHRSRLVEEARDALAQQQLDARVADYLARARDALSRAQLIAPLEDNARFYIESARTIAPNDARVAEAVSDLIVRLESEARQALAARNPDMAESWITAAAGAGADAAEVTALKTQVTELRAAASAEALAGIAHAFDERLSQGKLEEPPTDSAKFYLTELLKADAANASTQLARAAYGKRALEEAQAALARRDFAGGDHWLGEARAAGADPAAVGALETGLHAAASEAQQAASYVNEDTLKRIHYVAPKFPDTAWRRGIEGWVELHFVVGTDGAVSDLTVVAAQPVGVFEQAALAAVAQWRYQAVQRDGQPVRQRAQLRVRFKVQR